jgi:pyruvate,water dikinase
MTTPFVYFFGAGQADGGSEIRHLVGGKGASLADMTKAGLNVPPGFTISAACCDLSSRAAGRWPDGLADEVRASLARLEQLTGRPFGRGADPLLVAVRSGAAQSMPGMMDTVLNVGLNPDCVRAIGGRAAWDAYRHFLAMFAHTVGGVEESVLAAVVADALRDAGKGSEAELSAAETEALCGRLRDAYRRHAGRDLPDDPWAMLCEAIDAVFRSWNTERAVTYRRHHRIDGLLGTAVNVQAMCPAEVSGVLFTANPVNPALEQLLIESSYGLGEAVVLGKVTPDRFVLDKRTLQVIDRAISAKDVVIPTLPRDGRPAPRPPGGASLSDEQLAELARLGQRVEAYFGVPCDVEWALSGGEFFLLQARPIRGLDRAHDPAERERVRQEEIDILRAKAEPGGTVWARFNLSEILPDPTPMTWAVVRRFMSGAGGFGLTYRDLGYEPDPSLDEEGVYDLVCGRPYCNLSREPRLYARGQPLEHDFAALKAAPQKALYPRARPNWSKAGWKFWLFGPAHALRSFRFELHLQAQSRLLAGRLREEVLPAFAAEFAQGAAEDLSQLDEAALLARLEHWIKRTLYDFARESLKATVLAAVGMGKLEYLLGRKLGPERARAAIGELVMGVRPEPDADLPGAVRDLAAGKLDRATFLERFGHRGPHEMELAQPRWAEAPAALDRLSAPGGGPAAAPPEPPGDAWERVAAEANLPGWQRNLLAPELKALHAYLALREAGKHHLMKGYALIRRVLVELDRRHALDGGIFFLTPEELPRLAAGEDLSTVIADRRRRREIALSLEVPQVLFSDDLEAIGHPAAEASGDVLRGVPLSAGVAEAAALVLEEPAGAAVPAEPYILVCPSTDPAWVPLFVHAKGLVMETGGVLSHGAIVAREFGLPAVAGLGGVHRRLKTGQRLRVDGGGGTVTVLK